MNNTKTGLFIKELRKENGMTQKELADLLHITDRAVSKWERGLCAPDISLFEQLSEIFGITVVELIEGERASQNEHMEEIEVTAKNVLGYSKEEIKRKVKTVNRRHIVLAAVCIAIIAIISGCFLWKGGCFFVIDKNASPNEDIGITVYNKALTSGGFSMEDGISLITVRSDGTEWRVTYGNCTYQGIWWAPDSRKYVLSLEYDDGVQLALSWLEKNSESNLSAYLSMGVKATELSKYGYVNESGWLDIEYQFLQWSLDSESMLIYYSFEDTVKETHDGYFWYNCETGDVSAVLQMG